MTAKELRQAAEHVKLVYSDEGLNQEYIDSITDYILANVHEDGEVPVDEAWLKKEWGFESPGTIAIRRKTSTHGLELVWCKDDGLTFCTRSYQHHIYTEPVPITTRSQFRALCKGLGIPSCVGGKGE